MKRVDLDQTRKVADEFYDLVAGCITALGKRYADLPADVYNNAVTSVLLTFLTELAAFTTDPKLALQTFSASLLSEVSIQEAVKMGADLPEQTGGGGGVH